jgi:ribose transport system permease protein
MLPGLERLSGLYLWALFIVVFGIWTPHLFLTMATVHQLASQQSLNGLVALAALMPLACGAYDLSIGANVNLSAVLVAVLQTQHNWSMTAAIVVAVVTGLIIGVVNALIVVGLQVNSFIGTLGSATIIGAVQTIVTGGNSPVPPISSAWNDLTQYQIFGFQVVFLYLIVIGVIIWWFLARTPAGRYIYATGSNPDAARLSGVSIGSWTSLTLILSGLLCGITGVLYASLIGPSVSFGDALLLPAFAAAFLGATQFQPGKFNVPGSLLAIFVLATGVLGLQLITSVQWLNDMFNGVALVGAVGFAGWRQRARRRAAPVDASDASDASDVAAVPPDDPALPSPGGPTGPPGPRGPWGSASVDAQDPARG